MEKKAEQVALETSTWDRIDAEQRRSGQSRDEVIDKAVRRALGGDLLDAVLARVRERSDLTPDEADAIAAEEKSNARDDERSSKASTSVGVVKP